MCTSNRLRMLCSLAFLACGSNDEAGPVSPTDVISNADGAISGDASAGDAATDLAESDTPIDDDAKTAGELAITFVKPKDGDGVKGLVELELYAQAIGGTVASLELTSPAGVVDQDATVEVFSGKWDSSAVADGPWTIEAKATDAEGHVVTTSIQVVVTNHGTGQVSGTATLDAPLGGLAVAVATFDDFVVGAPIGAGTTNADGTFSVAIAPLKPDGRIVITIGDDVVRATAALQAGVASNVAVTGLTALALDLAGRYHVDKMPTDEALATAADRLSAHLSRPEAPPSTATLPAFGGGIEDAATLSALLHAGLASLAKAHGDAPAALLAKLRLDLGDGVFDGLQSGELLNTNGGYVLTPDTTRYELASAVHAWLAAGGDAGAIDDVVLAKPGGFYADVSLDDGPLYPPDSKPKAYDPFMPTVEFVDPTPPDGSFHSATLPIAVVSGDNGNIVSHEYAPLGFSAVATENGVTGTLDTALFPEGPLTWTISATDDTGNVASAARTFNVDRTGPVLEIASPPAGSVQKSGAITLKGTALDAGAGVTQVKVAINGAPCCGTVAESDGSYTLNLSISEGAATLGITAIDAIGNETTKTVEFSVDAYGPEVTIESPAKDALLGSAIATVTGTVKDAYSNILSVSVDSGTAVIPAKWAPDGTFTAEVTLAEGENTITVSATDEWGHETPEPPHVTVTVDTAGPALTIDEPLDGAWFGAAPIAVSGTTTDAPAGVAKVQLTIDGGPPNDVELVLGAWTTTLVPFMDEAPHTVTATATDELGATTTASVTVNIDLTKPELTFVTPPPAWVASKSTAVAFKVLDAGSGAASVVVAQPGVVVQAEHVADHTWVATLSLDVGPNDFVAHATDAAGNASDELAFSIGVDFDEPTVTVDVSPEGYETTHWIQAASQGHSMTGTAMDASSGVAAVTLHCDDDIFEATLAPVDGEPGKVTWTFAWTPALAALPLSCQVRATDAVGLQNVKYTSFFLNPDGEGPTFSAIAPPPGAWLAPGALAVTGTIVDTAAGVAGVAIQDGPVALVEEGTFSATLDVPAADGTFGVTLVGTDLAGNTTLEPVSWKVDGTPPNAPDLKVKGGAAKPGPGGVYVAASDATVSCFALDDGSGVATSCLDDGGPSKCDTTYVELLVHPTEAGVTVTCVLTDKVGNARTASITVFRDVAGPALTLDAPSDGAWFAKPSVALSGTISDGGVGAFEVRVTPDGGQVATTQGVDDGQWIVNAQASALAQTFVVVAKDWLGNTTTLSRTFNYDPVKPAIALGSSTYMDEKNMTVTVSGATITYGTGPALAIGPSCAGKCTIRKYVTRAHMTGNADIAANNLPVLKLQVTDNGAKKGDLTHEYRFSHDASPQMAWRKIEDNTDGALDGTVTVPWAIERFTDDAPATFVFVASNVPNRLELRSTDLAGNVGTATVDLDVQLVAPPLVLKAVESPPADPFDIADYTLDGYTAHELFGKATTALNVAGGARMLVVDVQNPYDHPLAFTPEGGTLGVAAVVRRPYLAATTNTNALCSSPKSCSAGQCTYTWSDTSAPPPAGCVTSKTAKNATIIWSGQGTVKTVVRNVDGSLATTTATGYVVPAKGALRVELRAGLTDACLMGPATEIGYIHAATPPINQPVPSTVKLYRWPSPASCLAPGALADTSHCMLNASCPGATYLNPLAVAELHISATAGSPLDLDVRVPTIAAGIVTGASYSGGYLYKTTSSKVTGLPIAPYSPY